MTLDQVALLEREFEGLSHEEHCASAHDIARGLVSLVLPPENISTVECAAAYRYLPDPEGEGKRLYNPSFTPYMTRAQNSLDDPRYRFVVVVGPGRTGKSIAGENHLFKRLRNGPLTDTIIFLPGKTDLDSYADKEFADFFTLHPEIADKLGKRTTDNKRNFKRVQGRAIQLFPANPGTVRQKQAPLILATEIDGYRPALRGAMKELIGIRGRFFGNQFKAYLESHPDAGWSGGIAPIWKDSTRGLWYWPCARCGGWSSPHPLARKGFHMTHHYERDDGLDDDAMLDVVAQSAGLKCPHCGKLSLEADKAAMLAAGAWIFAGQMIDNNGVVTGHIRESETDGTWIHGTMSPMVSLGALAREYVTALLSFERTRKPEKLREVTVKSIGIVYEGGSASNAALDPNKLRDRATDAGDDSFEAGMVPAAVLFITASVDVGGSKFDVMIVGWDLEGRSWIIERFTIKQRFEGGRMIDIRPAERIEDWMVLEEQVLNRVLLLQDDPDMRMPVAGMAVDTGDGHVTEKAREFARRMARARQAWGTGTSPWQKVRLIKGSRLEHAPELPIKPREVSKDEEGHPVKPTVLEYDLGVFKLKTQSVERVALQEDGPGFVRFASDLPRSAFDEFKGEVLIDGEWIRLGDNESLDLLGYAEAVRLMLKPDRVEIKWDVPERRPIWAKPVPLYVPPPGQPAASDKKPTTGLERLAALNRR